MNFSVPFDIIETQLRSVAVRVLVNSSLTILVLLKMQTTGISAPHCCMYINKNLSLTQPAVDLSQTCRGLMLGWTHWIMDILSLAV